MATRSIVAEPYKDGWRGRYVHWDGSPQTRLPILQRIVIRDGVKKARKTLIHNRISWSSLCDTQKGLGEYDDPSRVSAVDGYGVVHTDILPKEFGNWMFHDYDKEFAWAQYLYILDDEAVIVCEWDVKCWKVLSVEPYLPVKV